MKTILTTSLAAVLLVACGGVEPVVGDASAEHGTDGPDEFRDLAREVSTPDQDVSDAAESDIPSFECPDGFVLVPAGEFEMGAPDADPGSYSWERPVHHAIISHAFCAKVTEVTQAEWTATMGNAPSNFPACGDTCPVDRVSWWDAVAYCNALSVGESLVPCYTVRNCRGIPGGGWGRRESRRVPNLLGTVFPGSRLRLRFDVANTPAPDAKPDRL